MEKFLLKDIENQALELRSKYQNYHNYLHLAHLRAKKKYSNPFIKDVRKPIEWDSDDKFNPFYVLKRKKQIAKAVSKKNT